MIPHWMPRIPFCRRWSLRQAELAPPPVGLDDRTRYPDPRFTVDQGNPTVHALTGYPIAVRAAPPMTRKCPSQNRPAELTFVMDSVDRCRRSSLETMRSRPARRAMRISKPRCGWRLHHVSGTRARDPRGDFLSVHTLVANVGIYTKPGGRAYVSPEESLLGTRGRSDRGAAAEWGPFESRRLHD